MSELGNGLALTRNKIGTIKGRGLKSKRLRSKVEIQLRISHLLHHVTQLIRVGSWKHPISPQEVSVSFSEAQNGIFKIKGNEREITLTLTRKRDEMEAVHPIVNWVLAQDRGNNLPMRFKLKPSALG
ncbi:hypothetical protein Bca52824_017736 [Brassica carinata]|uniref:Uncharacterized protein n=1 Tax=Brassica carinata TaxID=52824 RepID=A0A8X7VNS3_BRACI|nr:hypothetical protein Bca52824_017736 [Brassica carinata]